MRKMHFVKIICAVLVLCFAVCGLTACGEKAKEESKVTVTIKDMGKTKAIEAAVDTTVADALKDADITLGEKDETEPAKDAKITADVKGITIKRYAKVTVVCGSDKKEVELVGGTVEDAVKKAGFTVSADVKTDVPLTDYLKDGMTITLEKTAATEAAKATEAPKETEAPKPTEAASSSAPDSNQGSDNSGSDNSGYDEPDSGDSGSDEPQGVYEVDRKEVPNCDGSGHGYYIITFSDGHEEYEEY